MAKWKGHWPNRLGRFNAPGPYLCANVSCSVSRGSRERKKIKILMKHTLNKSINTPIQNVNPYALHQLKMVSPYISSPHHVCTPLRPFIKHFTAVFLQQNYFTEFQFAQNYVIASNCRSITCIYLYTKRCSNLSILPIPNLRKVYEGKVWTLLFIIFF